MSSLDEPLIKKATARKRATFQLSTSDAGGSSSSENDGPRGCRGGKGIASQQSNASVTFDQGGLWRGESGERVVNLQSDSSTFSEPSAKRAPKRHRNVQVVAAKREWGALGDSSSSSDDADFVESPKRCQRYRRMAAAMSVASSAHTAKSSEVKASPAEVADALNDISGDFQVSQGRRAALDWCLGFVAIWSFALAELYMICFSLGFLARCLLPILFLLISLEICLARTDPGIMRSRCQLKRQAAACVVFFEVGVVVALGICFGYHLVLAYRCMFQADFSRTFATELEALDPCRKLLAGALRRDSWDLFWMPLASVFFTWDAIRSCRNDTGGFTLCLVVVAVLQTSIVVSLSQFDGCVSLHLREKNGIRFQAFKWVRQATNARNAFLFESKHLLYRATEVASRVLVLAVVFRYVQNPLFVLVLSLVDTSVLVFALSPTKSSIIEACLLLLPFSLYDVGRFLDEPGFAWPSQRESNIINRLRALEFLAAVVCSCVFLVRGDSFALWILPPMVLLSAAKSTLWNYTELSSIAGDIFTAIAQGQLKDVKSRVEFEGCSTINLRLKDGTNRLPLHIAVSASALDVAKFLLESRAEVGGRDWKGDSPLHYACQRGDLAMVGAILSASKTRGATIGSERNLSERSPADVLPVHLRPQFAEMIESMKRLAVVDDEDGDELYCEDANGHDDSIMQLQTTIGIWNDAPEIGSGFMRQLSRTHEIFRTDVCKLLVFRSLGEHCERLAELFNNQRQSSAIQLQYLTVDKVLGVGSFGKVMKVQDIRTGTFYAMKLQCKNKSMKQAVREAKTLHTNRHPFVVDLIHIFKTKAFYGILLEYCPCDLNARIISFVVSSACVGGLPLHLTSRYTACIMLALEYLHFRHVVYRDLKPENILVTDRDQGNYAKLTDFGLARSLKPVMESTTSETPSESSPRSESSSRSGRPRLTCKAGTLAFMPNEAIDDDPNSTTCDDVEFDEEKVVARDWYGLGCCMLLMLLGERGGVRIVSGKREVLLPPQRASMIPGILAAALKDKLIDEDAHELVVGLTEQSLALRMNATALRESPFLEDVILELETESGLREGGGVSSTNSLTYTDASATSHRRDSDEGDCSQRDCDDPGSQRVSMRDFLRLK